MRFKTKKFNPSTYQSPPSSPQLKLFTGVENADPNLPKKGALAVTAFQPGRPNTVLKQCIERPCAQSPAGFFLSLPFISSAPTVSTFYFPNVTFNAESAPRNSFNRPRRCFFPISGLAAALSKTMSTAYATYAVEPQPLTAKLSTQYHRCLPASPLTTLPSRRVQVSNGRLQSHVIDHAIKASGDQGRHIRLSPVRECNPFSPIAQTAERKSPHTPDSHRRLSLQTIIPIMSLAWRSGCEWLYWCVCLFLRNGARAECFHWQ